MPAKTETPTDDVSAFLSACLDEAEERRETRRKNRREQLRKKRKRKTEKIEELVCKRLGISTDELEVVEGNDDWGTSDLYLVWQDRLWFHRPPGKMYDLQVDMDDPESEDHYYTSISSIESRADLGAFLEGEKRKSILTKAGWEKQQKEKENGKTTRSSEDNPGDVPAQPVVTSNQHGDVYTRPGDRGLTKREYFAARAMQGLAASTSWEFVKPDAFFEHHGPPVAELAEQAVAYADALIDELNE